MKKPQSLVTMGITSLFLIFTVLCLGILSLLTLGNSRSDRQLSQKALEKTTAYYQASSQASSFYADLDTFAENAYFQKKSKEEYYRFLFDQLPEEFPALFTDEEGHRVTMLFPVTEKQQLQVTVELLYPLKEGEPFLVAKEFCTITAGSWTPDQKQPVYRKENTNE